MPDHPVSIPVNRPNIRVWATFTVTDTTVTPPVTTSGVVPTSTTFGVQPRPNGAADILDFEPDTTTSNAIVITLKPNALVDTSQKISFIARLNANGVDQARNGTIEVSVGPAVADPANPPDPQHVIESVELGNGDSY